MLYIRKIETKIELRISKELCKIQNHYIYKACVKCGRGCYNVPDGIFFLIERITKYKKEAQYYNKKI